MKDKGFCSPIIDHAAAEAKRKQEMDDEVAKVKKEYEEKQKKKKEKEKEKDSEKGKDDKKDDEKKDEKKKDEEKPEDKVSLLIHNHSLTYMALSKTISYLRIAAGQIW